LATSDMTIFFEHPYVKRLEAEVDEFKSKYEKQARRTEDILEDANKIAAGSRCR
jgi:plasmid maintenance system killer protein